MVDEKAEAEKAEEGGLGQGNRQGQGRVRSED